MADHSEVEYTAADGNDYPAHEQMYRTFVSLVKWTVIIVGGVVTLMYIFLT